MGGYGSGRQDGRVKTDQVASLDVRHLYRRGVLAPGTFSRWTWTIGPSELNIHLRAQGDHVVLEHWVLMPDGVDRTGGVPSLDREDTLQFRWDSDLVPVPVTAMWKAGRDSLQGAVLRLPTLPSIGLCIAVGAARGTP
jgi:hypothetical protein